MITVKKNIYIKYHKCLNSKATLWFLHGLGESSLSFKEAFSSNLNNFADFYIPDLPGFGATPIQDFGVTLDDTADILICLMEELSSSKSIILIAHSAGHILGLKIVKRRPNLIKAFISVEGNLTEGDTFLTSQTKNYSTHEEYYHYCLERIKGMMGDDPAFNRYYASLRFCHSERFFNWAKELLDATGQTKGGDDFLALDCPKSFFWGELSTAEQSKEFILSHNVPNIEFKESGHWPMIDYPDLFYQRVKDFVEKLD